VADRVDENLAITRRWYADWNKEGLPGFERVWAPDIVNYLPDDFPETGVVRGPEELARRVRGLLEGGGHFQMVPVSLEGHGDYVLAKLEVSTEGPISGAPVSMEFFQLMRYRDGLLVELRDFSDGDRARSEYRRLSGAER
jgi:ketosteroid isomerase-like protein